MFLKSLTIAYGDGTVIRDIPFHQGLNLIIDKTPLVNGKETGNNVGKTTVLKLVDFCLGADAKEIYTDPEHRGNEYKLVKDYLIKNKIIVILVLKEDLAHERSREVHIERNFLSRKHKILRIDGVDKTIEGFEEALTALLFPGHYGNKPTFRQIIAHNIRYSDLSVNNTLRNVDPYTKDDEYETLYLFLLGCEFKKGEIKQQLRTQISLEENFKKRLESEQTKSTYETALAILESEIDQIESKKSSLNLNPNFEADLDKLNGVKYKINLVSSELSRLELRKSLISEAQHEMQSRESAVDVLQLKQLYQQATSLVGGIHKTFEELNRFHNQMVKSKLKFVSQDLPRLEKELLSKRGHLTRLLAEESVLAGVITQSDSFEGLEKLIEELNSKYRLKGEYENILQQLNVVDSKLVEFNKRLAEIDNELFSEESEHKIKEQINKFNQHFSGISFELYGERYALRVDPKISKGRRVYVFKSFNTNFSSGKKQGEISCFDIAYTIFADEEEIPCMHFLLNDKKELMHGNQLLRIATLVNEKGIQFVASILKDKLPEELNKTEYLAVKLSQSDKLFKIEG